MSGQINLYNPQLRRVRELFNFSTLLAGLGSVAVLVACAYGWYAYQAGVSAQKVREHEARLQQLRDETAALRKVTAERGKSAELEKRLNKLESHYVLREKLRVSIEQVMGGNSGFSEYMRAFARQSLHGVWLTGFTITSDGSEMSIDGRALNPDLVPAYIARLNREPLLQGRRFAQLAVRQEVVTHSQPASSSISGQDIRLTPPFHEFRLVSSLVEAR
jgi:hypothetical protein